MQQHVKRALLLLGVVIIVFLIVRSIMVPESFGKYGWYRGNSVNDNMNFKVEYSNSNKCADCHKNIYSVWTNASHKTVNCETSHGQSEDHINNIRIMPQPVNDSKEFCGLCHFKRVARPSEFPQIDPESEHGEGLRCTYCHNPHKPWFL
jgi:hypothetical protein